MDTQYLLLMILFNILVIQLSTINDEWLQYKVQSRYCVCKVYPVYLDMKKYDRYQIFNLHVVKYILRKCQIMTYSSLNFYKYSEIYCSIDF